MKSLLTPNEFSVCCTHGAWSEPAHSSFQKNSATLELHDHFTSWRQISKHWLIWKNNNHAHPNWQSTFSSSFLSLAHYLITIAKNLGTSEIWPQNFFQALFLLFGSCFSNIQLIQLNLANSFSHPYIFSAHGDLPKKLADTLANQNKNSMILDA